MKRVSHGTFQCEVVVCLHHLLDEQGFEGGYGFGAALEVVNLVTCPEGKGRPWEASGR